MTGKNKVQKNIGKKIIYNLKKENIFQFEYEVTIYPRIIIKINK